jgi:hypothetical protein
MAALTGSGALQYHVTILTRAQRLGVIGRQPWRARDLTKIDSLFLPRHHNLLSGFMKCVYVCVD